MPPGHAARVRERGRGGAVARGRAGSRPPPHDRSVAGAAPAARPDGHAPRRPPVVCPPGHRRAGGLPGAPGRRHAVGTGGGRPLRPRPRVVGRAAGREFPGQPRHDRRDQPAHVERAAGTDASGEDARCRPSRGGPVHQQSPVRARVQCASPRIGRGSGVAAARAAAPPHDLQHQPRPVLHGRRRVPEAPGGAGNRRALAGRPDAGGTARCDRDPAAAARGAPVPLLPDGGGRAGRGGGPDPRLE